jgi:aryl-alcohol dehydrogenase-like predicted oxidoreductase
VEAFQSLQTQGKVRFYGITGFGDAAALHRVIGSGAIYTMQACYNLLNPSGGTAIPSGFPAQDFDRHIELAVEKEVGVLAIRVLAAGAISGVEERHPVAVPSVAPMATGRDYREDMMRARSFNFLVEEGHVGGLVEAGVRFALGQRGISTVLVGYSSLEQLEEAVQYASRGPLPPEAVSRLPEVWASFVRD